MSEKFKELFGFFLCFIGFVYLMEHFDFRNNIYSDILLKNTAKKVKKTSPAKYKNTSVSNIPAYVYQGAEYSGLWLNVLKNDKKVVFYVQDEEDTIFNKKVNMLLSSNNFANNYDVFDFRPDSYKSYKRNIYSSKKICNTLQECNSQRKNASSYTEMAFFFDRCARSMCIINPKKKQYVMLRNREYREVLKTLTNFANW